MKQIDEAENDARKEHADDFAKKMDAFMKGELDQSQDQSCSSKFNELKVDEAEIQKQVEKEMGENTGNNDGPEEPPSDSDDE